MTHRRPRRAQPLPQGPGIALLGRGLLNWAGGIEFLRLIASGLLSRDEVPRPISLVYPVDSLPARLTRAAARAGAAAVETLTRRSVGWRPSAPLDHEQVASWFRDMEGGLTLQSWSRWETGLARVLRNSGSQVVLPVMSPLPRRFAVPWVGYIYDFQHRYLPELFSPVERVRRDRSVSAMLRNAPVVIANAAAVRDDVARFFPGRETKVVTLPFSPVTRLRWFESEPQQVGRQFGLPDRYFIVCNQFWVHKDHATAIRALRVLHEDASLRDVALVCTGKMEDYRAPGHAATVRSLVRDLGLDSAVHFLGHVKKDDQMALVRAAKAVVQPTLFEGGPGGGAAYDAVAVGTPLIASAIDVNREVDLGEVHLFEPGNQYELAARMVDCLPASPRPEVAALLARSQERVRLLGERLMSAVGMAVDAR